MQQAPQSEFPDGSDLSRGSSREISVLALGLNAWAVLAALPMALAGPTAPSHLLILVLPLTCLGAGVLAMARSAAAASWLLLAAFPIALAACAGAVPHLVARSPYGQPGLVLGALSLIAFGAVAATATSRLDRAHPTRQRDLGPARAATGRPQQRRSRRALLVLAGGGAAAIALLAPGAPNAYRAVWGEAAAEAATLTTVVAGALAATTLAVFVGPTLRAARGRPAGKRARRRRVLWWLGSAALGMIAYAYYAWRSLHML